MKTFKGKYKYANTIAICLEDSIGDEGEDCAIENVRKIFSEIRKINSKSNLEFSKILSDKNFEYQEKKNRIQYEQIENQAKYKNDKMIFVRIKDIGQMLKIKDIIVDNSEIITAIVLPKSNQELIENILDILNSWNLSSMSVIPIIESKEFLYPELKEESFLKLQNTIIKNKERILSIRIGTTDILGIFGTRRSDSLTLYENDICANFIKDVVLYLNRDEIDIPISGGVSELFDMKDEKIRKLFMREIKLDKLNGLFGKTVIHPMQIPIVQSMCCVTYHDYKDALQIVNQNEGIYGVCKSSSGQKMNEAKPHLKWAKKILKISDIYGVLNEGIENEILQNKF
jgi:citrate lyase beta subunit